MLSQEGKLLTAEEIVRLARLFVSQGVTKIRLTGGEPTVRKDLLRIVEDLGMLRAEGLETLSMTTNGIVLRRLLKDLHRLGMSQLNISLDTLDPLKFELITRRRGFERVVESIDEALKMGFQSVKVNVVVMRGVNEAEVPDFVELTRDKKLNVRFIEYMPFDGNRWSEKKLVPYQELIASIRRRFPSLERLVDDPNDTAKVSPFLKRGPASHHLISLLSILSELQGSGICWQAGIYHIDERALLWDVQPNPDHGRRELQSLPLWGYRDQPARCHEIGHVRRCHSRDNRGRGEAKEGQARRDV